MHEITISGAARIGKILYADRLELAAMRGGLRVAVSDYEIFSLHKEFSKKCEKIRNSHKVAEVDISILVVNDGSNNLRVDFGGPALHYLAGILFSIA